MEIPVFSTRRKITAPTARIVNDTAGQLRQEYETSQFAFQNQPLQVRKQLEQQAAVLAEALLRPAGQAAYRLPAEVFCQTDSSKGFERVQVPEGCRSQRVRARGRHLTAEDLWQHLSRLEQTQDPSVSACAELLLHATALSIVHDQLPAGLPVQYITQGGDTIPTIPEKDNQGKPGFYLPEWVAFDGQGRLLAHSLDEARKQILAMQRFLYTLHAALELAPYLVCDEVYQQKHYGMLGQLVHQGRALAQFETNQIIQGIWRRAAQKSLNRGFSLSLPYFDDQALEIRLYDFEVIPAGRVEFAPVFVAVAARMEEERVAQNLQLNPSTRHHLIAELRMIERAFEPAGAPPAGGTGIKSKQPAYQRSAAEAGLLQGNAAGALSKI